ncbi:hypothetical protein COCNU_11G003380 [Cocos nucifera]|uniref:Uncharacterized protein n=1 Tax=Cocos nucifera TaxID=13894 RepID=A0A8K0INI1_COCNU|nr:hypothetical protein COCNU_11G003380 [Cocos nucifera]
MLMRGLPACKRKEKALEESSKKVRVDIPISVAPISAMGAPEIALEVKVSPAIESDPIARVVDPPMPSSPPTEFQVPEPPLEKEKEVRKKKIRRALRKSQRKAQEDHQAKVEHLIKERNEVDRSFKDRSVEVKVLQEALCKEKEASIELKAILDLEEERRKRAEAKIAKLKEQILRLISEASARSIEVFKVSSKMRDLNVKFGQEAFNKGYKLCEESVTNKFSELDLDFLYEGASEEVVLDAATQSSGLYRYPLNSAAFFLSYRLSLA